MHDYISRRAEKSLAEAIRRSPAVAVLGPRQAGKSTLAKHLIDADHAIYLDLQKRSDLAKLDEPELFFEEHRTQLVCLDEIQRVPDLFNVLRSEIDQHRVPGRFLLLGSASRDLVRNSNETLAGRIAHLDLTPFLLEEVDDVTHWKTLWWRGGFPDSLLANDDAASIDWRIDFIRTFLERDIPNFGFSIPAPVIERLWRLLAHCHGQTVNYSKLAGAADLSVPTLKKYLALLEQTYMIRLLPPWEKNLKKRIVKSAKIYLRDTGILHTLLDIDSYDQLLAHPVNGPSWESLCIENLIAAMPRHRPAFIRSSNNAEVDLVMEKGDDVQFFEFKLSKAPKPARGFFETINAASPSTATVIAPVDQPYTIRGGVTVTNLLDFIQAHNKKESH
jgi:predicted AAA+ superfamily ATPase